MSRNRRRSNDSTTDEDQDEPGTLKEKYISIKLPNEKWQNKKVANQLKNWLRKHASLQNRSYAGNYLAKFIEVAQIASKFTDPEDQDRAFDEVMSIFVEWPKFVLNRQVTEFSNQTLLEILTELGLPYWFNRIFYVVSRTENILNPSKEFQGIRENLINHKDSMGNTFSHYLMKFLNSNPNDAIYTLQLALNDPLWFASVRSKFIESFSKNQNEMKLTPLELLDNTALRFTISRLLQSDILPLSKKSISKTTGISDASLSKSSNALRLSQRIKSK